MVQFIPIRASQIIKPNHNLVSILMQSLEENEIELQEKDILVIAENVVGTTEGRQVDLKTIEPQFQAEKLAIRYDMDDRLVQVIIQEADWILGGVQHVLLTINNNVVIANAGIDQSNVEGKDIVLLWPENPFKSAEEICHRIKTRFQLKDFGVIISDSHVQPMKRGVIGSAIGVAGFYPVENCVNRQDLFGRRMRFTERAIADQIASGSHLCMGECDEQTPFVLARNVNADFTDAIIEEEEMVIDLQNCLFMNNIDYFYDSGML